MAIEKKKTEVDLEELASAIEDQGEGISFYVDRETGNVVLVTVDSDDKDLPVPREEIEDSARFVLVDPEDTDEAFRDMEDFAATVPHSFLRVQLEDALDGDGPFAGFRGVLKEEPEERKRWFAFKRERLEMRAREWLEAEGFGWRKK